MTDLSDVVLYIGPTQHYRENIHAELKLFVSTVDYRIERRGVHHHAAAGRLVALHADDAHSGGPAGPVGEWSVLCLPTRLVSAVADPADVRFEPPVLTDPALARRFRAVLGLFERPVAAAEREEALLELIAVLIPHTDHIGHAAPIDVTDAETLHAVREFLAGNLSRNVPLDELADLATMSKFRLVRLCTAYYGLAPHALHLRLRLDHARHLIRTGKPLAEVGQETGFHDQPHFTRTFVRAYGTTPSRYRAAWTGTGPDRKLTLNG